MRCRFALGLLLALVACKSHWKAEITQPALTLESTKVARTSLPLSIVLRDPQLRMWVLDGPTYVAKPIPLATTAYYVAVSRDRFRFHVSLVHKFESMCDIHNWTAWVEDANGTRYTPEDVGQRYVSPVSSGSQLLFYRGYADFEIYRRDLFDAGSRITLVLQHPGYEFRYIWNSGPIEPET
jgi:hypothetical protein